ncbi:hypothetical protein AAG570_013846 [Ranatra chinensis]|uniref:C2H2-type domain-containing protein n=1 Tax=Ranatra chinensis TaxID=642074 RepID=A0ABD0YDJ5_9HEMI
MNSSLLRFSGSDNSDVDSDDTDSSDNDEETDVAQMLSQEGGSGYLFPWTCNRCGEAFTTKILYTEHKRNCTELVHHPWACHKCPSTYKNKKDLVRHLIYCGNEVARLICNRCGNSYKYERGLKRHQKYCGTDTKPLRCVQCKKTYKYKRGLRRHQKRCVAEFNNLITQLPVIVKTETVKEPDPPSTPAIENQSGAYQERWTCHCGKEYKYKKSYMKHIDLCSEESGQNVSEEGVIENYETNLENNII